jgi:hypothetical protein
MKAVRKDSAFMQFLYMYNDFEPTQIKESLTDGYDNI